MLKEKQASINGNSNSISQIESQNNYYVSGVVIEKQEKIEELKLNDWAFKLLEKAVESEKKLIKLIENLDGTNISCGSGNFLVNSINTDEKELAYWKSALANLKSNGLIEDIGNKNQIFKVTSKGYDYYDKEISILLKQNNFKFNYFHIEIIKIFKDNNDSLWESQLKRYYNNNYDKEIAFEELKDHGYIMECGVYDQFDGACYSLNSSRKIEILKKLKEWK